MLEMPSLGPGVATSSTRKSHETGTGAGSASPKPVEVRSPPARTVSSQVVQAVEPLFSAAAKPAILKPVIPLLVGKGVDAMVFAPKRPKEAAGVGVTDVVFTAKTIAACSADVLARRVRARMIWILMLSIVQSDREVDHFL